MCPRLHKYRAQKDQTRPVPIPAPLRHSRPCKWGTPWRLHASEDLIFGDRIDAGALIRMRGRARRSSRSLCRGRESTSSKHFEININHNGLPCFDNSQLELRNVAEGQSRERGERAVLPYRRSQTSRYELDEESISKAKGVKMRAIVEVSWAERGCFWFRMLSESAL